MSPRIRIGSLVDGMSTQQLLEVKFDPANTPRPDPADERIVRDGIQALLPHVKRWLDEDDSPDEEIIDALFKAWSSAGGEEDGYALARKLEQRYWSPDAELVEILGSLGSHIQTAHGRWVREWVKVTDVTLPDVGSRVVGKAGRAEVMGEVITVYPDAATCVVRCPGHKPGEGWVLNAETLTVLRAAEASDV